MTNSSTVDSLTQSNLDAWDRLFCERVWGKYPPEELVRFTARNFYDAQPRSSVKFLEEGFGQGANLWYLYREGFAVHGIDGSETALRQTRTRLNGTEAPEGTPAPELRTGNFRVLPWAPETFDVVFDIESVSANVTGVVRSAIAEAYRVLKPRGLYFAKMFGVETTGAGTGKQLEPNTSAGPTIGQCSGVGTIHFFERQELDDLFQSFGTVEIGSVCRTEEPGNSVVFEWVVTARK